MMQDHPNDKPLAASRSPHPACTRHARHARQRGSVYLAVLGASMLVTLIGVSAVMAVRIQGREAEAARTASAARDHARSAVELALLETRTNPDWADNTDWRTARPIGRGWLTYRFLPDSGTLDNDDATVWIVGVGVEDHAIRVTRVAARRRATLPAANWVPNSDMSRGSLGWELFYPDDELEYTTQTQTLGPGSLMMRHLGGNFVGLTQDLEQPPRSGETLELAADVRLRDSESTSVRFGVLLTFTDGSQGLSLANFHGVGDDWQRLHATVTPSFAGELSRAQVIVLVIDDIAAVLVDNVTLQPGRYRHELVPVPTTWRQDVF